MAANKIVINYETVKEYYQADLWTADDVRMAAEKGYITYEEAERIINGDLE